MRRGLLRHFLAIGIPILLVLLAWEFAEHAIRRGLRIYDNEEVSFSRLHHAGASWSNSAVYGHMAVGGILTILAPLQLIGLIRQRVPILHRCLGYAVAGLAIMTAIGGLLYILWQGTIGGWIMNIGFSIYGLLVIVAAIQTVNLSRKRNPGHREWALRLVMLALGSWLYRVHYDVWYMLTGGMYSKPDFTGGFDYFQTFAFYLPYLLVLEMWMRLRSDYRSLSFPTK